MTFHEFVQLARDAYVEALHVESLEGDVFLFRAFIEGNEYVLLDEEGNPLRPRSLGHARKWLYDAGGLESVPMFLVQETPYDEMIGLDAKRERHMTRMTIDSGL